MNKHIYKSTRIFILVTLTLSLGMPDWIVEAGVIIDRSNKEFAAQVEKELIALREGRRGVVSLELARRLETSASTTTIRPVTLDESTWHSNDLRGTRSHVVPVDTRLRGEKRGKPTSAILYLHPNRINPSFSVYKLGTFIYELSQAVDLNRGEFSGDYTIREKRAVFFRNAWCDSQKFPIIEISGRVPTPEYKTARDAGVLTLENAAFFPILDSTQVLIIPSSNP